MNPFPENLHLGPVEARELELDRERRKCEDAEDDEEDDEIEDIL